jgi:hypothetical protein
MNDRFDQEFYTSEWRRVLPLGPDGIQPYVRASHASRLPGAQSDMGRLIATLGTVAHRVIAFGRLAAERPVRMASAAGAQRRQRSLRLAHEPAGRVARPAAAPRCPSRAA